MKILIIEDTVDLASWLKKDGLQLCRELREKEKNTPVIMLTSMSSNEDIITGLEAW